MCDRCAGVDVEWAPTLCPDCGRGTKKAGESVWCLSCGWGRARYPMDEMLREREYKEMQEARIHISKNPLRRK